MGLWQVATVWGFGVALSIYSTASVSGAHLNPAVSLAFAIFREKDFAWRDCFWYMLFQMLGGILGGVVNLACFSDLIEQYEEANNIDRDSENGVYSAMMFGEYFPHPGAWQLNYKMVSPFYACMVEAWGTCVLMFMILALTDSRNKALERKELAPLLIGFTVACLISVYAPITQAGWNPARDFGPRIVAAMAGWGEIAIPGPRGGFWVFILGPFIGAPVGAFLYDVFISPGLGPVEGDSKDGEKAADSSGEQELSERISVTSCEEVYMKVPCHIVGDQCLPKQRMGESQTRLRLSVERRDEGFITDYVESECGGGGCSSTGCSNVPMSN